MGKGRQSAPTSQTITQQNIPAEFMPYFERLMGRVEEQSLQPYTPYGGPRIAPLEGSADTTAAWDIIRGLAEAGAPQYQEAADVSRGVISGAKGIAGLPASKFTPFSGFQAGTAEPFAGFQAGTATPYSGFEMAQGTPFSGFSEAGFREFGFGPAGEFTGEAVSRYMDPYIQNVVDIQKERAQEDYDIARAGRSARAVAAGAFGGSRAAVQEGLAERDLLDRQRAIQAEGLSTAYGDAQRMFEADRAARVAQEQARAAEAARVQGGAAGEAARVQSARAAELARVQGMTQEEFARVQAAQAAELARTQGIDIAEASRIQQAQAAELARTQGISLDEAARVQAARAAEQGRVQAASAAEALARGELGLSSLELQARQAGLLGSLGDQQRAALIQNAQLLEEIGRQQTGQEQAGLDIAYQDFLRQQGFPQEQLAFYSDVLRGLPVAPTSTQTQQQYAYYNPLQQMLGGGLSALSLFRAFQG